MSHHDHLPAQPCPRACCPPTHLSLGHRAGLVCPTAPTVPLALSSRAELGPCSPPPARCSPGSPDQEAPPQLAKVPLPDPSVVPTPQQLVEAERLTDELTQQLSATRRSWDFTRHLDQSAPLAALRTDHSVIRTLRLARSALEAHARRLDAASEAAAAAARLATSRRLTAAGAGSCGRVDLGALVREPDLVVEVIQQALRDREPAVALQGNGRLYQECGKPESFDEYVEDLLGLYGSDEVGRNDWVKVCMSDEDGPVLTPAEVRSFKSDPLTTMLALAARRPLTVRSPAPPSVTYAALRDERLTPAEVAAAEEALCSGTHAPETELSLCVIMFQAIGKGNYALANTIHPRLSSLWRGFVMDALYHGENHRDDERMNVAWRRSLHAAQDAARRAERSSPAGPSTS